MMVATTGALRAVTGDRWSRGTGGHRGQLISFLAT